MCKSHKIKTRKKLSLYCISTDVAGSIADFSFLAYVTFEGRDWSKKLEFQASG